MTTPTCGIMTESSNDENDRYTEIDEGEQGVFWNTRLDAGIRPAQNLFAYVLYSPQYPPTPIPNNGSITASDFFDDVQIDRSYGVSGSVDYRVWYQSQDDNPNADWDLTNPPDPSTVRDVTWPPTSKLNDAQQRELFVQAELLKSQGLHSWTIVRIEPTDSTISPQQGLGGSSELGGTRLYTSPNGIIYLRCKIISNTEILPALPSDHGQLAQTTIDPSANAINDALNLQDASAAMPGATSYFVPILFLRCFRPLPVLVHECIAAAKNDYKLKGMLRYEDGVSPSGQSPRGGGASATRAPTASRMELRRGQTCLPGTVYCGKSRDDCADQNMDGINGTCCSRNASNEYLRCNSIGSDEYFLDNCPQHGDGDNYYTSGFDNYADRIGGDITSCNLRQCNRCSEAGPILYCGKYACNTDKSKVVTSSELSTSRATGPMSAGKFGNEAFLRQCPCGYSHYMFVAGGVIGNYQVRMCKRPQYMDKTLYCGKDICSSDISEPNCNFTGSDDYWLVHCPPGYTQDGYDYSGLKVGCNLRVCKKN